MTLIITAGVMTSCETARFGPSVSTPWMSSAAYQAKVQQMIAAHYYPRQVEGRRNGSLEEYRATFVSYPSGRVNFYAHHGLGGAQFSARDKQLSGEGFTRTSLQTFVDAQGTTRYQAVWTNRGSGTAASDVYIPIAEPSGSSSVTGGYIPIAEPSASGSGPSGGTLEGTVSGAMAQWNTFPTGTYTASSPVHLHPYTHQGQITITLSYQKPNADAAANLSFWANSDDYRKPANGHAQMSIFKTDPMIGSKSVNMTVTSHYSQEISIKVNASTMMGAGGPGQPTKVELIHP